MIELMTYTYMFVPKKVKQELNTLWKKYLKIIYNNKSNWKDVNKARAILYLTGNIYCEQIVPMAIEKRLPSLSKKLSLIEFLEIVDNNKKLPKNLKNNKLFKDLVEFYKVIKEFKNKYKTGKYYLEEEKFLKQYTEKNPDKKRKIGFRGKY